VLKQRVITALLLLPLALAAVFMLPTQAFMLLLAIILMGGCLEYSRLAGLSGHSSAYLLIFLQAAIFSTLFVLRDVWGPHELTLLAASCVAWLFMFVRLQSYRPQSVPDSNYRLLSFITALASITTGWFAVCWLRLQAEGSWLILMLLLIVWAADTGAYFAGRAFGKKKLAPNISPGKTVAGLFGGLALAPVVALLALYLMPIGSIEPSRLVLLTIVTALISVGGDLMISMHKRISGHKDSGHLLPGHGGILDRLDSLLAAAPFFALGLHVTGTPG